MKTKTKIKSVTIIGRRWFQRSFGNTYCTAEILIDGKLIKKLGPEYGYDSYFEQMARTYLAKEGIISFPRGESYEALFRAADRLKFEYTCSVSDVAREGDL